VRGTFLALAVGSLILSAWAASAYGGSTGSERATAPAKPANIASFAVILANPYDTSLTNAQKKEAAKLGAKITIFDAKFNPSLQVGQCQDALASGKFNIFLLKAVTGPPLVRCAQQAIAKGIKVVVVDDPLGPKYTLAPQVKGIVGSILSLPTTNGKALAKMTVDACAGKNPCKVAYYFGPPTFVFSTQSRATFNSEMAKHPNIKVVFQGSSQFQSSLGTTLTTQLLTTHPDVNVITSDSDQAALGAYKALRSAGKTKDITLIGGGGSCLGAAAIKAHQLYGTSALYPASLGKITVDLGVKALNGQPLGKTQQDVSYLSPIGPIVTQKNVGKFHCEW
jgi:ribose transport system substrate-binding protein